MNSIVKWSGVVALAILVILGGLYVTGKQKSLAFGSTSCASITCLSGGLRLVSDAGGDFESDVAAVFNSTVSGVSAAFSGALAASSTLQVSGATRLYSTSTTQSIVQNTSNTATTTALLGCIQTTATSTANPIKLSLLATTTLGASGGFIVVGSFGTCP